MKSRPLSTVVAGVLALITTTINAAVLPLEGRLETALGSGVFLAYYDPNQDISWAADANINGFDNWDNQVAWAAGLTIGGVSGWRLPTTLNPDATCDTAPADSIGFNCTGSEMGYLFNVEGITVATPGPFSNVQPILFYWSGTEFDSVSAWIFIFDDGFQAMGGKISDFWAWAVHDGNVPAVVPVPAAVWLFGSGLMGLVGVAKRRKHS